MSPVDDTNGFRSFEIVIITNSAGTPYYNLTDLFPVVYTHRPHKTSVETYQEWRDRLVAVIERTMSEHSHELPTGHDVELPKAQIYHRAYSEELADEIGWSKDTPSGIFVPTAKKLELIRVGGDMLQVTDTLEIDVLPDNLSTGPITIVLPEHIPAQRVSDIAVQGSVNAPATDHEELQVEILGVYGYDWHRGSAERPTYLPYLSEDQVPHLVRSGVTLSEDYLQIIQEKILADNRYFSRAHPLFRFTATHVVVCRVPEEVYKRYEQETDLATGPNRYRIIDEHPETRIIIDL